MIDDNTIVSLLEVIAIIWKNIKDDLNGTNLNLKKNKNKDSIAKDNESLQQVIHFFPWISFHRFPVQLVSILWIHIHPCFFVLYIIVLGGYIQGEIHLRIDCEVWGKWESPEIVIGNSLQFTKGFSSSFLQTILPTVQTSKINDILNSYNWNDNIYPMNQNYSFNWYLFSFYTCLYYLIRWVSRKSMVLLEQTRYWNACSCGITAKRYSTSSIEDLVPSIRYSIEFLMISIRMVLRSSNSF